MNKSKHSEEVNAKESKLKIWLNHFKILDPSETCTSTYSFNLLDCFQVPSSPSQDSLVFVNISGKFYIYIQKIITNFPLSNVK